jgi:hypothetical protein
MEPEVHCHIHKRPPSRSQMNSVYILQHYSFKTYFNIILSFILKFPKWLFASEFPTNILYVGSEVFTAVSRKMDVFWVVAPCSLVEVYHTTRRYNPEDSHLNILYIFVIAPICTTCPAHPILFDLVTTIAITTTIIIIVII